MISSSPHPGHCGVNNQLHNDFPIYHLESYLMHTQRASNVTAMQPHLGQPVNEKKIFINEMEKCIMENGVHHHAPPYR